MTDQEREESRRELDRESLRWLLAVALTFVAAIAAGSVGAVLLVWRYYSP